MRKAVDARLIDDSAIVVIDLRSLTRIRTGKENETSFRRPRPRFMFAGRIAQTR
ncbi:MAG: hypothetical protein U1A27_10230 [Phycisphaerae bacterium]